MKKFVAKTFRALAAADAAHEVFEWFVTLGVIAGFVTFKILMKIFAH
jgi:hypothetical protein